MIKKNLLSFVVSCIIFRAASGLLTFEDKSGNDNSSHTGT